MKRIISLIVLFTALVIFVSGQSRNIESIGIDNITIIEIADNNDIWAGSLTKGVAFYQVSTGQWAYFDSLNVPMRSNSVTSIAITPIAGVPHSFIGTASGGVITQPGTWDTIAQVAGTIIHGIAYRPDSLWVVTGSNFVRYDSSFNHVQNYTNTHPGITCVKAGPGPCPGFWFGTVNSGCYFTSNATNLTDSINTSAGGGQLVNNHVNAIAIEPQCDRVFVGTQGGFSSCPLTGPPCQNYTTSNGLPQNDVSAVVIGCGGNVWIGTRDSGVVVYNTQNQQFTRVTTASSQISALACAKNCITYVGSPDGTITQVDSNKTVIGVMTGIKTLGRDLFSVNVFPQPSGDQINFAFEKEIANGDLYLSDMSGRILQQISLKGATQTSADVSSLNDGIYFYHLYSNNQLVKTGKLDVIK